MSFTPRQQPEFRALVTAAWLAHCRQENLRPSLPCDRDWYEQELHLAVGKGSTKDCHPGRDYDRAMAHFEALAGTGIHWQMRLHSGDARRILHELRRSVGEQQIDEDYLRACARRMLRLDHLPPLETLTRPQLLLILGEIKRHLRRRQAREKSTPEPRASTATEATRANVSVAAVVPAIPATAPLEGV